MPQGSTLGPILYTIFTSDMPCTNGVIVATYADDTASLTLTLKKGDCPNITLNGSVIHKSKSVNYLGICLYRRLTWRDHVKSKRTQVDNKLKKCIGFLVVNLN